MFLFFFFDFCLRLAEWICFVVNVKTFRVYIAPVWLLHAKGEKVGSVSSTANSIDNRS